MFDASEIYFLDRAVDLSLLTPNQRGRLLSVQDQVEAGTHVTALVVDAGLMTDDEVRSVLDSIASGVARQPASSGRAAAPAFPAMSHTTTAAPSGAPTVATAAGAGSALTLGALDSLLDDEEGGPPSAISTPASRSAPQPSPSSSARQAPLPYDPEAFLGGAPAAAAPQAFPMPGQDSGYSDRSFDLPTPQAFPLPGQAPAAAPEQQHYGMPEETAASHESYGTELLASPVHAAPRISSQLAVGAGEMESVLSDLSDD